jgi:hypothetical protein
MSAATQHLYNRWIKSGSQEPAYLIYSQNEGVLHCSESEDLTEKTCQIMIGFAVKSRRLWAPEAMTDPLKNNPQMKSRGWAVVTRDTESKKITKFFTRDVAKFTKMQETVRNDAKVSSAFYYYPNQNRQVVPLKTARKGRTANYDTYELIANFVAEEFGSYKTPAGTEKDLKLITLRELNLKKTNMRKKLLSLYNGSNSNLIKPSHFVIVFYDKRYNRIQQYALRYQSNMRQAINQMANDAIQFYYSRRHFDYEFMLLSRKAGPLYCSASEDFADKDCARMIGWAVQTSPNFLEPPVNKPSKEAPGLLDDAKYSQPIYIALVRDTNNKVSRLNFTDNQATSTSQFKAMVGEGRQYKSGMLFRNQNPQKNVYAKVSALRYEDKDFDIYEIWTQYLQEVCGIYRYPITNE